MEKITSVIVHIAYALQQMSGFGSRSWGYIGHVVTQGNHKINKGRDMPGLVRPDQNPTVIKMRRRGTIRAQKVHQMGKVSYKVQRGKKEREKG